MEIEQFMQESHRLSAHRAAKPRKSKGDFANVATERSTLTTLVCTVHFDSQKNQ